MRRNADDHNDGDHNVGIVQALIQFRRHSLQFIFKYSVVLPRGRSILGSF